MDKLFSQKHYNCQVKMILLADEKVERTFLMHSQHTLYRIEKTMRLVFGFGAIKGGDIYNSSLDPWHIKIHDLIADGSQVLGWSSDDNKYQLIIVIAETEHEARVKKPVCIGANGDLPIELAENYAALCTQAGIEVSDPIEVITALLKWEKEASNKRRKDYQDNYLWQ